MSVSHAAFHITLATVHAPCILPRLISAAYRYCDVAHDELLQHPPMGCMPRPVQVAHQKMTRSARDGRMLTLFERVLRRNLFAGFIITQPNMVPWWRWYY